MIDFLHEFFEFSAVYQLIGSGSLGHHKRRAHAQESVDGHQYQIIGDKSFPLNKSFNHPPSLGVRLPTSSLFPRLISSPLADYRFFGNHNATLHSRFAIHAIHENEILPQLYTWF